VDTSLPFLRQLVNYPQYLWDHPEEGKRSCVMCGKSCLLVGKRQGETEFPAMVHNNRGVCTACENGL
jgi:hypothetical protein